MVGRTTVPPGVGGVSDGMVPGAAGARVRDRTARRGPVGTGETVDRWAPAWGPSGRNGDPAWIVGGAVRPDGGAGIEPDPVRSGVERTASGSPRSGGS